MTVDGVDGVWMPVPELDAITLRIENLEEYRLIQDQLVLRLEQQVATSSQTIALWHTIDQATQEYADLGWRMYRAELKQGAAWYNQPVFWVVVGIIVGGGTAALTAWGVTR